MYELLDRIDSPADLKSLDIEQLRQLCSEIRQYMVECCATNPGHLGASLGAVELIVGWHYVFDAPEDKLVFDVGHQAYAHKILTGRREAFKTLRTKGGLSGFPKPDESPYDAFVAGHASNSISAALGLAEAERILAPDDVAEGPQAEGRAEHAGVGAAPQDTALRPHHRLSHVCALIGDGALTGGLAFEGLNNAGASMADLLVILNDNEIAIDRNLGGLHNYLVRVSTSRKYNAFRNKIWDTLGERSFRHFIQKWHRALRAWLLPSGGGVLENLGFRCFGPIDGNDIAMVVNALQRIKELKGPRVLHCITKKGKGYAPAESDPVNWHAPGRFNPETGEKIKSDKPADRYQDVFGAVLCELAEKDRSIVAITPAMTGGSGLSDFAARYPNRFFDVGIEEEHAATFSAGLAAGGLKPFCSIYSSFAQRAYDQLVHDAALQHLPVVFCLDRAGLVGEDGATHTGAFDMAACRSIPGIIVSSPKDEEELKNLLYTAANTEHGPFIIRYPRGYGEGCKWKEAPFRILEPGKAEELAEGDSVAVIATGPCVSTALKAAAEFPGKVGVYDFRYLKPFDSQMLEKLARAYRYIVTIEDGCLKGGLYGEVCECCASLGLSIPISGIGIADEFVAHATQAEQRALYGLDKESIVKKIQNLLENQK